MATVPGLIPVTIPDNNPTVAIVGLALLHDPEGVASLSVVVLPVQIDDMPVTGESGLTVTVVDAEHPAGVI